MESGRKTGYTDSFHSYRRVIFLRLKLFQLERLIEDLPAVLGQDDCLFGCPSLHLSKGFHGNRSGVKSSDRPGTKGLFHLFAGRDKFRALSKEIDVTSLSKEP